VSWVEKDTACATLWPGTLAMVRSSQPVGVPFTPGVPVSMKSWASKWERLRS